MSGIYYVFLGTISFKYFAGEASVDVKQLFTQRVLVFPAWQGLVLVGLTQLSRLHNITFS